MNQNPSKRFGATLKEWQHFAKTLGLEVDLLPVVSDQSATISKTSQLKALGKTPSLFNAAGDVVGIKDWTNKQSDDTEIAQWARNSKLGICVQTRLSKAFDIDVEDKTKAGAILAFVRESLGSTYNLAMRYRANSGKMLIAFDCAEIIPKMTVKVEGGIVEFLGNGQQFIAVGTHKSGIPYEWEGELPLSFPKVSGKDLTALFDALAEKFGVEEKKVSRTSARPHGPNQEKNDPVADYLFEQGLVLRNHNDGKLDVACPWASEHTGGEPGDNSTTYFVAGSRGFPTGGFRCQHAHCAARHVGDFARAIGFNLVGFDEISIEPELCDDFKTKFQAYLPDGKYIHLPTGKYWAGAQVNNSLQIPSKKGFMRVDLWLQKHAPIHTITWAPGYPRIIEDHKAVESGLVYEQGLRVYNQFEPCTLQPNDGSPQRWLDHVASLFPDEREREHLLSWMAFKVQSPGEKVNHALVIGGAQGIGKGTLLAPLIESVGEKNVSDINPQDLFSGFNEYIQCVILRVNEARDLGAKDSRSASKFELYERTKTVIAAPPDAHTVNRKYEPKVTTINCCGVIFETNHLEGGMYLPESDRRHFVVWSDKKAGDYPHGYFEDLWAWLKNDGYGAVMNFFMKRDLSLFDPKASPPKTPAWCAMVGANGSRLESGLRHLLEGQQAFTINDLGQLARQQGEDGLAEELDPRKTRAVSGLLRGYGFTQVPKPGRSDPRWPLKDGSRAVIFCKTGLPSGERERLAGVRASMNGLPPC